MKKEAKKAEEKNEVVKQKREIPTEQRALNEMMRGIRKVGFKLVKSVKDSELKDQTIAKMGEAFTDFAKKLDAIRSEALFLSRFSTMSEDEKNLLRSMLNK